MLKIEGINMMDMDIGEVLELFEDLDVSDFEMFWFWFFFIILCVLKFSKFWFW